MMLITEDDAADILFVGVATDAPHQALLRWKTETAELHDFPLPDYHRLQLEHWVWSHRDVLRQGSVMDVGCQIPRRYLGDGYFTLGMSGDTDSDVFGDLCSLELATGSLDAIVCTEVLEHCANPFLACQEMYRTLRPGGLLLVTSPFLWPDHRTVDYPDYFRFTEQGWRLLLRWFRDVTVTPCAWTSEGTQLLDLVRRFEGWGFKQWIGGTSAYLCSAIK